MDREYEDLKLFWDDNFKGLQATKFEEEYLLEESFTSIFDKYIKKDEEICLLDYGCGSGWLLFDLNLRYKIKEGTGIDTSSNAISYCLACKELGQLYNLYFLNRDQRVLSNFESHFDYAVSVNTLDVLPDEIVDDILKGISFSLKKDGYFILCINPQFNNDELTNLLKMEIKGNKIYKDNILRGNLRSKQDWIDLVGQYFDFIEYHTFIIDEREKTHSRQMFVLKKK